MEPEQKSGRLDDDERAELARLRSEVSTLRAQVAGEPPEAIAEPVAEPARARPRNGLRWTAVGILLVLVALLAIASVASRYVRSQVLDTDRYVSTVAPLGSNPAIQAEITSRITEEIFARVDVEALTAEALNALTDLSPATANRPR